MNDSFRLARFVEAQEPVYDSACQELRQGLKRGHWMWFIFPQIAGLGSSSMAARYAIASREEASAYLDHAVLGARLRECTQLVNLVAGRTARQIFGDIDAMKFRSSMTLFAQVAGDGSIYRQALNKYFKGQPDPLTLGKL